MSYRLYVHPIARIPSSDGDENWHFDWVLLDAGGGAVAQGQRQLQAEIEQVLAQNDIDQVRLMGLLPGHFVSYCQAHIPAKQARYIRQALPFAVEEQLAQDIETLHLALGERRGDNWDVAAIDNSTMDAWTDLFDSWQGAVLTALYPDADLVPLGDAHIAMIVEADEVLIRVADSGWFRIPVEGLAMFVESLLQQALQSDEAVRPERKIKLYGREEALEAQRVALAAMEQEEGVTLYREITGISTVGLLAHAHHGGIKDAVNLCQGRYQPDSGKAGVWHQWRTAAAVAGIWFVLQMGFELGEGFYYAHQAEELEAEAVRTYRSVFPDEPGLTAQNLQRRLQARLNASGDQGQDLGFLSLMRHAGYQYSVMPGRNQTRFNSISYSDQQGELRIDVQADDFTRLNTLKTGLEQVGLQAQIGSVVNAESGARGRITVSGG